MPRRPPDDLDLALYAQATRLLAEKHLELTLLGYPARQIEAGMSRAWGMAEAHVRALSAPLRGPAFIEWLQAELVGVGGWIEKKLAGYAR